MFKCGKTLIKYKAAYFITGSIIGLASIYYSYNVISNISTKFLINSFDNPLSNASVVRSSVFGLINTVGMCLPYVTLIYYRKSLYNHLKEEIIYHKKFLESETNRCSIMRRSAGVAIYFIGGSIVTVGVVARWTIICGFVAIMCFERANNVLLLRKRNKETQ